MVGFLAPPALYAEIAQVAGKKGKQAWWKCLWLGIMAGVYIGFGSILMTSVAGQMLVPTDGDGVRYAGLQKFISGLCFQMGLTMVMVCGAELFTGNAAVMVVGLWEGTCSVAEVGANWGISYVGNLIGSLLIMGLVDASEIFQEDTQPVAWAFSRGVSEAKVSNGWGAALVRGLLANLLVCVAVWQATAGQSVADKVLGIFFPVLAFVAMGLEHSVANMFLIPMGMKNGNGVSVGDFVWMNLIPVTLGNIIAGSGVLATGYSLSYGSLGRMIEDLINPADKPAQHFVGVLDQPPNSHHSSGPVENGHNGHKAASHDGGGEP